MRARARVRNMVILGLVLSLAVGGLAGCTPRAGPTSGSPVVRLGYLQADLHQLPAMVALEQGFFAQAGVDVKVAGVFASGPEEMSAFAGGSLEVGYVGLAPVVTAAAHGTADVVILALANSEGSALVLSRGSSVTKGGDLAGKTIAVPGLGNVQDVLLRKVLDQAGLRPQDVTTLVIKPPEMVSALRNKQIDGFVAWEPFPTQAVEQGVGWVYMSSHDIWPDHPCCVVAVSRRFYQEHPDTAGKILQAHVRAINWIKDHPDQAISIARKYTGLPETVIAAAMKNIKYGGDLRPNQVEEYIQVLNAAGLVNISNPEAFSRGLIAEGSSLQNSDSRQKGNSQS